MIERSLVQGPVEERSVFVMTLGADSDRCSLGLLMVLVGEPDGAGVCDLLPIGEWLADMDTAGLLGAAPVMCDVW